MTDTPSILSGIRANMEYLSRRQQVLAQNIANSETPGYRARDLARPDFAAMVGDTGGVPSVATPRVELTAGMRAMGATPLQGARGEIFSTDIGETKPDGNNVTIEDQLLQMSQVQADFTAMASLYRKQLDLMRAAIGRRGA